jgi:ubiquinol-cytochrome c reductase cytochrome c1 subunit
MKKLILFCVLLALPALGSAAGGGGYPLAHARVDLNNKASLQRGAKLFVNHCMGCHSAHFQRYNRLARDLNLTDELVLDNLVFTGAKVGDTMENAMPEDDAKRWFGAAPPDLTLIGRSRSPDYLYTYLTTFYLDEKRPLGVNNAVFPAVGMPHVLWELQGWQKPVLDTIEDAGGEPKEVITGFEIVQPGSMTPPEFNAAMNDLVNFLVYIAEPMQLERQRVGFWVLFYLVIAFVVFYLLKKEYWKDVH